MQKYERVVTGTGLSIGTGLAFESILHTLEVYDTDRKFDVYDVSKYDVIFINIFTLVRNIIGSLETMDKKKVLRSTDLSKYLKEEVEKEIYIIRSIFDGVLEVIFYTIDYSYYAKEFILRPLLPKTVGTLNTEIYTAFVLTNNLLKREEGLGIQHYKEYLKRESRESLVLTHVSIDLLSTKTIKKLSLLESHTSKIVDKYGFSKKYFDKQAREIPFCKDLLNVLGDKTFVQPAPIKIRKMVWSLAKQSRWTVRTTCGNTRNTYVTQYLRGRKR